MEGAFHQQHGKTLNFAAFSKAVARLNDWYKSRGLLGQVGPGSRAEADEAVAAGMAMGCGGDLDPLAPAPAAP